MGNIPKLRGKFFSPGEKPSPGIRLKDDLTFNTGVITNVDPDRWIVDIELFDRKGNLSGIKITQSYAGTSSFIATMPEKGAIVIVTNLQKHRWILAYMPNYMYALDGEIVEKWPDNLNPNDINVHNYRIRKLLPGQIALGSNDGCEFFLGNDVKLETGSENYLRMRQFEKDNTLTGLNNCFFSSGVWCNAGTIQRNSLSKSLKGEGLYADYKILPNKRVIYEYRPEGDQYFNNYMTEYLLEVEDVGSSSIPENDMNSDSNRTPRNPIAVFGLGNFVGNDVRFSTTYGKPLGVSLFKDPEDKIGQFQFIPLPHNLFSDIGLAISLFKPDRFDKEQGAFFGIDKEGHFYHYLPAATAGGLGDGRSLSLLARGNRKEVWGKDTGYGNSWDYTATGGIRWDIGSHDSGDNNPQKNRSFDLKTSNMVFFRYGSSAVEKTTDFDNRKKEITDLSNYRKIEKVAGKERKEVSNTRETIIGASDRLQIQGMKQQSIAGGYSTNVGLNMALTVGSMYSENVTKEKRESFGSRVTNIKKGSSELTVDLGNIKETITAGNKITAVKAGSIKNTITGGPIINEIEAGSFSVNIKKTGTITLQTKSGSITLKTSIGKATLDANLGMDLKSSVASTTSITSGSIKLKGKTMLLGNVITSKTHRDYITGAFLNGSTTVQATL